MQIYASWRKTAGLINEYTDFFDSCHVLPNNTKARIAPRLRQESFPHPGDSDTRVSLSLHILPDSRVARKGDQPNFLTAPPPAVAQERDPPKRDSQLLRRRQRRNRGRDLNAGLGEGAGGGGDEDRRGAGFGIVGDIRRRNRLRRERVEVIARGNRENAVDLREVDARRGVGTASHNADRRAVGVGLDAVDAEFGGHILGRPPLSASPL